MKNRWVVSKLLLFDNNNNNNDIRRKIFPRERVLRGIAQVDSSRNQSREWTLSPAGCGLRADWAKREDITCEGNGDRRCWLWPCYEVIAESMLFYLVTNQCCSSLCTLYIIYIIFSFLLAVYTRWCIIIFEKCNLISLDWFSTKYTLYECVFAAELISTINVCLTNSICMMIDR